MATEQDAYRHGQWLAICDRCGFQYYSSKLRKEWTGLRVCSGPATNDCWEPRHPQDFVRGRKDNQSPPWVRPEPEPVENAPSAPDWDDL